MGVGLLWWMKEGSFIWCTTLIYLGIHATGDIDMVLLWFYNKLLMVLLCKNYDTGIVILWLVIPPLPPGLPPPSPHTFRIISSQWIYLSFPLLKSYCTDFHPLLCIVFIIVEWVSSSRRAWKAFLLWPLVLIQSFVPVIEHETIQPDLH